MASNVIFITSNRNPSLDEINMCHSQKEHIEIINQVSYPF